ncbi:tyrosine-type recombinase/integrase [Salmonella enterica]|nr:tyrosine-type recombinase/integrase [Salmonella enterica]
MTDDLLKLVDIRGNDRGLKPRSVTRARWAVQAASPVLSLGIRAASSADYWRRHALQREQEGRKASTICTELNAAAALFKWLAASSVRPLNMAPASATRIHDAIRTAARDVGKRVKRFKPLARPARVGLESYADIVAEIESLPDKYKLPCRIMLILGFRVSETLALTPGAIVGNKVFIAGRETKNSADLALPMPARFIPVLSGWLSEMKKNDTNYDALYKYIARRKYKWRPHALRKVFRSAAEVRGEDFIAVEMILNHSIDEVKSTYLLNASMTKIERCIRRSFECYIKHQPN